MKNSASKKVNVPLAVLFSVLTLGGLAAGITGIVLSQNSMNDSESFPKMTVLLIAGMVVFSLCLFILFFILSPFIMRKMMNRNASLTKDYLKEVGIPTADTLNAPTVICPICHTENPSTANFCSKCGKELSKVCPECNTTNSVNNEYCTHCGKKL